MNAQTTEWLEPPKELALGAGEVHVWRAQLAQAATRITTTLREFLSPDEQERAARFHSAKDSENFIVARGLLRIILGRYLGAEPDAVRFSYSDHNKPALAADLASGLRFNLSHSGEIVLYGVTRGREIGLDVERIRPTVLEDRIPEHFFAPGEIASLQAFPPEARTRAFFAGWTRKEAYIKARGDGLSLALDRFEVSLAPNQPAALLGVQEEPAEVSRWTLAELVPGPGYIGAVAVEGQGWRLQCWDWQDEWND